MGASTKASTKRYTNIKMEEETRSLVKAVAAMVREEYYEFIETAIIERIIRETRSRNLPLDLSKVSPDLQKKIEAIK